MKYPGTALQLDTWVSNSQGMFGLGTNMETNGPSIVIEVWEKITSTRVLR